MNAAVPAPQDSIVGQRVALAREGRNPWLVARMRSGWLVMSDTQVVPGQLILLGDPVVGSLNDLDAGQRAVFLADIALAGDALLAVTGCLRVNYDILGNTDPALHAHIVPRYASEPEGRRRMRAWLEGPVDRYEDRHDDLAADATSRLSPYLHFGCVSPAELVHRAKERGGAGAEAFVRQVAWRDFHRQLLAAQGWMPGRGRLITASFLTKTLYVDWRVGARHFLDLLVDGDVANNQLNWQWVAGTGAATRPNQVLNPLVQARRFDPRGEYVRRWVPELAGVEGAAVHRPWELRRGLDYPDPIVDLDESLTRFRKGRNR